MSELWNRDLDGRELVKLGVDSLLKIRPTAVPNRRVLRMGVSECVPHGLVSSLSEALVTDSQLAANYETCVRVQRRWHQDGQALRVPSGISAWRELLYNMC